MNCNELTTKLRGFHQPESRVYFDPPDGKGGLYEICAINRPTGNGKLPRAVLSSVGSFDPIEPVTVEGLRNLLHNMPEESEVFYDDSDAEPLSKLVPVQDARLLQRPDLDRRGFSETEAPAIMLSSRVANA